METTYRKPYLSNGRQLSINPIDEKEKEREKKKQIRSLQGKIQRLRRKLVETRDEKEYYKAKRKLAEQQTRLDLLLGRSLDDY